MRCSCFPDFLLSLGSFSSVLLLVCFSVSNGGLSAPTFGGCLFVHVKEAGTERSVGSSE